MIDYIITWLAQFFTNKNTGLGVVKKLQNKNFTKGEYSDKLYNGVMLKVNGWNKEYLFTDNDLEVARKRAIKNIEDFKDFEKK